MQVTARCSLTSKSHSANPSFLTAYQQFSVCSVLRIINFLDFANVLFLPNSKHWRIVWGLEYYRKVNIWYDTFQFQNKKRLWLVNNIITTLNSDNVLGATFGRYPCYVVGILNSVKHIHFYVLCNKHINYTEYITNLLRKMYTFKVCTNNYFILIFFKEKVVISFQSAFLVKSSVRNNICSKCVKNSYRLWLTVLFESINF
jgi:hypothetical protein